MIKLQNTVYLASLGCSKNQVDSEILLGLLQQEGYVIVEEPQDADVIIVNTCGFIQSAKEEAIETILTMAQYKEKEFGQCQLLIAMGCLVQRYAEELMHEIPEVDGFYKVGEFAPLLCQINGFAKLRSCVPKMDNTIYCRRKLLSPGHFAYLRIADGCNNCCAYCAIPAIRGKYSSRPMEDIIEEAKILAQHGVKELILVAQDTTNYGKDLYGSYYLPTLLKELCRLPFLWIRILYTYPDRITDELLQVMAEEEKICPYLDIPLQHSEKSVLQAMNRQGDSAQLLELLAKCRAYIPNIAIRTTLMVGFPGETAADFKNLLSFIEEAQFDWVGVFSFCPEDGTKAETMKGQIPDWIKQSRQDKAMQLLAGISAQKRAARIGKIFTVLIEELPVAGSPYYVGRCCYQAPEVDGVIYVAAEQLNVGDVVEVEITDSDIYDLKGRLIR